MRREHILQQQSPLPPGYRQLEYLESTGTQYIDSGILDGENLDFELVVKQRDTNTNYMFFGARYGNRNDEETLMWAPADNLSKPLRLGYKSTWYFAPLTREEWHTITMDGNKLYVDGTQVVSFTKSTFIRKYSVFLFAASIAGGASYSDLICFASAKLYESGTLVRDYIPMLRTVDTKPGMYDLCGSISSITGTPFYINQGTGEFLYN